MTIGINADAAFKKPRTGVEEYTYQLIKHLTMLEESKRHRFVLYSSEQRIANNEQYNLSGNFKLKELRWFGPTWTQIRLAGEMVINKPDVLFIPVHVLPLVHPQNSVVTIHGLEYEYYPNMYPWRHLKYLRWSTKYALKNARKIIAVSENTKKDLVEMYGAKPEKIKVIYHGVENKFSIFSSQFSISKPFILYIGRIETKKNVQGLIEAFNLLKEKYKVPHKLILIGPEGYGYENSKFKIQNSKFRKDIIEKGYVSEEEKWQLLQEANMFVLPSFYEGFGMPILEAQANGCPVITSNISSMTEVAGKGAILIEPKNIEQIAQAIYKVISDEQLKNDLINRGYENVKRFSWCKCAQKTLQVLME